MGRCRSQHRLRRAAASTSCGETCGELAPCSPRAEPDLRFVYEGPRDHAVPGSAECHFGLQPSGCVSACVSE